MNLKKTFCASCLFLCNINTALSYEKVDTYQLTLEELMDIKVISVSKKEENQNLAPGAVTIVTANEIQRYGARHLRDVIDRLVGIQVLGSHQDFHSKTSMRALNSSHHEDTVLILLNGRPVRQATDGGLNSDIYAGFPLKSIDRIEVVRGPGSVIYGTNAMSGIINIITIDGKNSIDKVEADFSAGSYGYNQAQVSGLVGNDDFSFNLEVNTLMADGDPFENIIDSDLNSGTYETGIRSQNIFLNGRNKNFTITAMSMENHQDSASSAFQLPSNPIDLQRFYFDVGYRHDFSDTWDLSFNYTLSEDTAQWQINEAAGDNFSDGRSEAYEIILRGNIDKDLNLLFGTSHVKNVSSFDRGLPHNSRNSNITAYTQIDYMTSDTQKIIAGLQWNDPDRTSSDLSPRLGLIQGFADNWWLKLLYSEAYRSPNLVETDLDAPQLKGVPTLLPVNIATYDAQLIYQTQHQYYALALYHSTLENLIVRVPGTPTTHANEGHIKFKGIEFESRIELNSAFDMIANASYQSNKTDDGVENGTFAPQVMVKFGFNYSNEKGFTAAIFNSYIGETEDLSETNVAPKLNPEADGYNLLTANIVIDTGKLWGYGKPDHSRLSLYLDNILNEEIYAADLNFANANNTIPHHWGFGAYITYSHRL